MNAFSHLPLEILQQIFLLLERKTIKYLHHVLINIIKIDLQELLNSRRLVGYPRLSGHCELYYISKSIIDLGSEFFASDQQLLFVMRYLDSLNIDIVKGDLVKFDSSDLVEFTSTDFMCIFNGQKFLHLNYHDSDFGVLPREFHVIENSVPIKYWDRDISDRVWFNYNLVKDQCLANIKYELIDAEYGIFTTFSYNIKIYKIIYIYMNNVENINDDTYEFLCEREKDEYMEEFKRDLSSDGELVFWHSSEKYENNEDNILYVY